MFDKIHQKYCNNKYYMYVLERVMHVIFCIILALFFIAEYVCKKLNIKTEIFS